MDSGEELLRILLREKNVSSVSSWENAIKLMESDSRFESVRSLPNRKFIFNEYKQQKAREEKEEQRLKLKKAKEDLETFLNQTRISSSMRYRQACEDFGSLEVWKSVPDEERREIFNDVLVEIRKKEDEEAMELRRRNREEFRDILESMLEINSSLVHWTEAQQYLAQNEAFTKNENLMKMDKCDALDVFMDYLDQLEKEEEEERERLRKQELKRERDNRFAFVEFLDELHAAGVLTSMSKWQTIFATLSADPRYTAMLSQPLSGSTALDLFKFYVEDLKAKYDTEKDMINEILKNRNYTITLDTTFVDFATFVSEDERSANLDPGNLKMIFERLLEKEREKERQKQRQIMKERRKLEHDLYNVLTKHLDIQDQSKLEWETVRPLVCEEPAFKAIESEEDRVEIFHNYINSLNDTCMHHHKKPNKQSNV